jgi:hypothetical protein
VKTPPPKKKNTPTTICREEIDHETEAQTIAAIKERWRQNQNEKMRNTQILHGTKLHARKKRNPGSHQTLIQTTFFEV